MLVYVARSQWNLFVKICVPKERKRNFFSWKVNQRLKLFNSLFEKAANFPQTFLYNFLHVKPLRRLFSKIFLRDLVTSRCSRLEVFCRKDVLKNFAKFTGKHLCKSLFFNNVAGCFWTSQFIFNTFFTKHITVTFVAF